MFKILTNMRVKKIYHTITISYKDLVHINYQLKLSRLYHSESDLYSIPYILKAFQLFQII